MRGQNASSSLSRQIEFFQSQKDKSSLVTRYFAYNPQRAKKRNLQKNIDLQKKYNFKKNTACKKTQLAKNATCKKTIHNLQLLPASGGVGLASARERTRSGKKFVDLIVIFKNLFKYTLDITSFVSCLVVDELNSPLDHRDVGEEEACCAAPSRT